MSLPNELLPVGLLATPAAAGGPYTIERSLRFNSADSAYLSRTPSSAGNRKTWTWAGWVKISNFGTNRYLFDATTTGSNEHYIRFHTGDTLQVGGDTTTYYQVATSQLFRDPSAWYHIVVAMDTTQATDSDRIKIYVNGVRVTNFGSTTWPQLDNEGGINSANQHNIGRYIGGNSRFFDGYLADVHFVDGSALDPTSFGEFDANNVWQPLSEVSVNYGVNGFHLLFSDNSTAAALGTDTSGKNNTWTVNNISVAAGSENDSLKDVPVNGTETDTGLGGEVRGNYCTWNPLTNLSGSTLANGNLDAILPASGNGVVSGSFGMSSGKWYWEVLFSGSNFGPFIGIKNITESATSYPGQNATGYSWYSEGSSFSKKYNNATAVDYAAGVGFTLNDLIGVAFDADNGTLEFYKNGTSQGVAFTGIPSGTYVPAVADGTNAGGPTLIANFGQRPFIYQNAGTNRPAATYKALCTANLPTPTIEDPSTVMNIQLWTGNSTNGRAITGYGFSPDFVWIKRRSASYSHNLFDTVRGIAAGGWAGLLYSDSTAAEDTGNTNTISSFDSDGFTLGVDGGVNYTGTTYVGWCWDAGSSTVSNTQGSITSSVRANVTAGFSIVTYTGNGVTSTVGHGLGAKPALILLKTRSVSNRDWFGYHSALGATKNLSLNTNGVADTGSYFWNNTEPTSSVFTADGTYSNSNSNGSTYVAYCFAPVAGYSAFGSYTGNGSSDGPFVYTGFRPRWLLIKASASYAANTNGHWHICDTTRDTYNESGSKLYANTSGSEVTDNPFDILSNGFKLRRDFDNLNGSNTQYVFAAFAEHPFQTSRAR